MKGLQVVEVDGERLRSGAWHGTSGEAYMAPLAGGPVPRAATIRACLDDLARRGFRGVLTSALTVDEQAPFLESGFEVHERLHLLVHRLDGLPARVRDPRLRRGTRLDRARVLEVDRQAFAPFWQLDHRGLRDALGATPVSRFRVASGRALARGGGPSRPVGYAITGRSLDRGYLQRLAVDPAVQGRGVGRSLVLDALWWARRRGARVVLVNTQEANHRAVALYEALGFERQAEGLAVLHRALPDRGRA